MYLPGAMHAPRSYALYESLGEDALTMVSGSAYFSVLSPGARLRPHCGPTNVRLRVHIGLSIPTVRRAPDRTSMAPDRTSAGRPVAGMRVGNETRAWREGEALVFNDSFEHEVWNEGTTPRLVFIYDVWHPELRTDAQRLGAYTDAAGQQAQAMRYRAVVEALRSGRGLPHEPDLVADRRERTVY